MSRDDTIDGPVLRWARAQVQPPWSPLCKPRAGQDATLFDNCKFPTLCHPLTFTLHLHPHLAFSPSVLYRCYYSIDTLPLIGQDSRMAHIGLADVHVARVARRPLPTAPWSGPCLCWKDVYYINASGLPFCAFSCLLLI